MNTSDQRVLLIAHAWHGHRAGGGEIAPHNLKQALSATPGWEGVLMARDRAARRPVEGSRFSCTDQPREMLFHVDMRDRFNFRMDDIRHATRDYRDALEAIQPSVVHFHHYIHLGLELIRETRNWSADIPIVLTLHDYHAICHHHGQMVRPHTGALCARSSADSCHGCFPQYSTQAFHLRRQFILDQFALVDRFIAPSEFLRQRYLDWGLEAESVNVIENIPAPAATPVPTHERYSETVFGYFGAINPFKGLPLILEALQRLNSDTPWVLEINGSGLENQSGRFRREVQKSLSRLGDRVRWNGAYTRDELAARMRRCDWLLMGSNWWENSPMVIMEAREHALPVICPGIGGMAEKIVDGETGLHYQVQDVSDLGKTLQRALNLQDQLPAFREAMRQSHDAEGALRAHLDVYRALLTTRVRAA